MASTERSVGVYLREKRAAGSITAKTLRQQQGILFGFAEHMPRSPAKIRRRDVLRWMGTLSHLSANSRRLYFCAARHFCGWLQRRGMLARDPFADIPAPRTTKSIHRSLDDAQVARLLAACVTPRERVLILVGLHTGARRAELAALEVGDVSLAARTVTIRKGKGGDSRVVPLSEEAVRIIAGYIASEALSQGPLLRSERSPQDGIGGATVGRIFREVATRAGVKGRPRDGIAVHATRHSFATNAYQTSKDVRVVQKLLGHASLTHTARYVGAMDVEGLRPAVEGRSYLTSAS